MFVFAARKRLKQFLRGRETWGKPWPFAPFPQKCVRETAPQRRLSGPSAGYRALSRCGMRARSPIGSGGRGRWELIPAKMNGAESPEGVRVRPQPAPEGEGSAGTRDGSGS